MNSATWNAIGDRDMDVGISADLHKSVIEHNRMPGAVKINALGAVAQWAHETGHFRSRPMLAAWNLAGIKATRGWVSRGGGTFGAMTCEFVQGESKRMLGAFRSYPSLSAFLEDYAGIIARCYPLAGKSVDCVWLFFAGLVHGIARSDGSRYCWATDPGYFAALCRMAVTYAPILCGPEWKGILRESLSAAVQRGFPYGWMLGVASGILDNARE